MANQIDLRNVNIQALGRELGLKDMEGYKKVENKNPKDGYVYIKKDTGKNGGEFLTLKSNGAVFFKKYSILNNATKMEVNRTDMPKIDAHKAKIIQAALGEKVDAKFAKKHAKEIQEMKDKLFAPEQKVAEEMDFWDWFLNSVSLYSDFHSNDDEAYKAIMIGPCPCGRIKKEDTDLLLPGGYFMAPLQIHYGSHLDNEKKPTNNSEHPQNSTTEK